MEVVSNYFSYLFFMYLSVRQRFPTGNTSVPFFIIVVIKLLVVQNLLDCVGALDVTVPCCETTCSALNPGCNGGKWFIFLYGLRKIQLNHLKFGFFKDPLR